MRSYLIALCSGLLLVSMASFLNAENVVCGNDGVGDPAGGGTYNPGKITEEGTHVSDTKAKDMAKNKLQAEMALQSGVICGLCANLQCKVSVTLVLGSGYIYLYTGTNEYGQEIWTCMIDKFQKYKVSCASC